MHNVTCTGVPLAGYRMWLYCLLMLALLPAGHPRAPSLR